METRLLFRCIGEKHFAFQIRIDTDFIAKKYCFGVQNVFQLASFKAFRNIFN